MMLFVASILAYQFSPPHLTSSAANQTGVASVYSHESGSGTASGQKLDREAFTAAHRTLPFGTKVKITNKSNGRSVVVTINDRGPFVRGRVLEVKPVAARGRGVSGLTHVALLVGQYRARAQLRPQRSRSLTSIGAQLRRPDRRQS